MPKRLFAVLSVLIITITVITFVRLNLPKKVTSSQPPKSQAEILFSSNLQPTKKSLTAPGKQTYSITMAHNSPELYKAIIDPEDVKLGQKQTMTVYVKDQEALIKEVIAEIQTDKETIKHPLTLKSGNGNDGVWESSWIVRDTHDTTYVTRFIARNTLGETGEARVSWTDPGCSCTGTNCTVSTTCTVSGVDGADGGTLTVSAGGITVPAGTTLLAGALTVSGGYLTVNDTGTISVVSTNTICMTDADSDNYPANTTQIANCTSGRRRYLMASITATDCVDSNATVNSGQTNSYTVHRGDGSFDYNCDSVQQQQYTAIASGYCPGDPGACSYQGGGGYVGSVPACGTSNTWADSCKVVGNPVDGYDCVDNFGGLTQACR